MGCDGISELPKQILPTIVTAQKKRGGDCGKRGDYLFFPRLPTCDDLEAKDKPYRAWVPRLAASFSSSALSAFLSPPPLTL